MEVVSEKTPTLGITGRIDLTGSCRPRLKLHRVNSKDKLNNAFVTNNVDNEKKRSISKLPRVIKNVLHSNNSFQSCRNMDNDGNNIAGTSKPNFSSLKSKKQNPRHELDKNKGSHIPRRKVTTRLTTPDKKMANNNNYYSKKSQHIQRLHVPNISPDFRQDDRLPTTSIGVTRPIPTLGQIYRRNNIIIDGDRFYDWFMELDTPVNSLESNPRQRQTASSDSADTAQSVINVEVPKPQCFSNTERHKVVFGANTANIYKTTNDNIAEWLTSEMDYSGKDNESGYRSMSPHSRGTVNIESKHSDAAVKQSDENYCLALGATSERFETNVENEVEDEPGSNTDKPLTEQPTVVISRLNEEIKAEPVQIENSVRKIDIALEPIVICKSERSKNLQYPSISGNDSRDEKQAFAPSYVECPSEILQKTTNFEGDGCESPKTLSSIAGTDLEIRDDYSSLYTLENVDDCNLEDHAGNNWCPACRSQSCMTFIKSGETDDIILQTSYCGCHGDRSDGTAAVVMSSDSRVHRDKRQYCISCGRRTSATRHGDSRVYCKKHLRYRRFPSYRYRITRPFNSLRKKLSIRRLCRHRWNRVWKKTTSKWNHWSKSHSKLGKIRMLEYLQNSLIWEDVDVQTVMLVYRETGTHTNVMEHKSAGITTSIKYTTSDEKTDAADSAPRTFKSRFKQMNLGPSRFSFLYNSKRKSMPVQKVDEASKPVQRFYSYPENRNKNVETTVFKKIPEGITLKDTSIICGFSTTNADTSPIDLPSKCACQKSDINKKISRHSKQKSSKKSNVVCECPPTKSESLHKLKTVNDTGSIWKPPANVVTSCSICSSKLNNTRDECTQIILVSNNIETGMSYSSNLHNENIRTESNTIHFYKPCGINTDSINLGTLKMVDKKSAQMMTPTKAELSGLTTSSSTTRESELKLTKSAETSSDNASPTTDLATETSKPHLTSTDAKVTSISSAQMLPASVVTSETGFRPASSQNTQVNASTITTSVVCRCNECRVASTGRSELHVNKSTDTPVLLNEDKNIGPSNENKKVSIEQSTSTISYNEAVKRSEDSTTEALIDQWSQYSQGPILMDTGTLPVALGKKSTYVLTAIDQKSAYAVTSRKKTQSFNMVTSNAQDTPGLKRVTASTNTSHSSQKRSVGLSSPVVNQTKDDKKSTIDTWVQYSHILEQNEKQSLRLARIGHSKLIATRTLNDTQHDTETEPILRRVSQFKSTAIMTSGPFDEACNTAELNNNRQALLCACAKVGCDIETNTQSDLRTKQHTACSTQIFQSHCNQNLDKATCSSDDYTPSRGVNSRSGYRRTAADQLKSLSRLIGRVRSSSHIAASPAQTITSKILSSNLDAAKWIKRCTNNDEKDYQSLIDIEQSTLETLKQASLSIANSTKSTKLSTKTSMKPESMVKPDALCDLNSVAIAPAPITTISDDSLADVLPANSHIQKPLPPTDIKKMADKVTSDEVLSRPLKESILQTCPDVYDSGTDPVQPDIDLFKSASVLTSKCILPSPSVCCQNGNDSTGCVFIYDKPHCAVHKTRMDASVQISITGQDKQSKTGSRDHAIDQIDVGVFPCLGVPSSGEQRKKSNNVISEVLPPKAYKALYETTKMVVKDSRARPVGISVLCGPDLENEAAIIRALAIRSAAILTSQCGLPSNGERSDSTSKAEYVYAFNSPHPSPEGSEDTCVNCHARLLDLSPYYQSGVVEERVKTQLVDSCRYYSNLLTKRLERVKEKVTKHLAPSTHQCLYFSTMPKLSYTEAFTMKPSGREELGIQTVGVQPRARPVLSKPMSCCALSPSMTNICGGTEKHHLKSVYYMLSAIEGRIRRLKRNIPN